MGSLLDMVKDAVMQHTAGQQQNNGFDPTKLLGQISDLFGKHAPEHVGTRPASQDPYGDPADQGGGKFGNVKPASADPYGDPADQGSGRR